MIALLNYDQSASGEGAYFDNIRQEDHLLIEALERVGLEAEPVVWSDPDVDWGSYQAGVFRATWDYFERLGEFAAWLQRVEPVLPLVNPATTVRWNLHKRYLLDLRVEGLPVVPTHVELRGRNLDLVGLLGSLRWGEAVMKPAVSGAARRTLRIADPPQSEAIDAWSAWAQEEAMLLQPFQSSVLSFGELTLVLFDGRYSHAVRKIGKPGDFRVQDDHGGTVHPATPDDAAIALAERALATVHPLPAYGRVDLVRDADGAWQIMELELIEPELWLRMHPPAADAMARALKQRIPG